LNRQLNWSYGKQYQSYFGNSDVQMVLIRAINLRQSLYDQVQSAMQVEGMSVLGRRLEQMLINSITGLRALYNSQDYSTFNSYNQNNNAISASIRQQFGIR
jgi:hypothetical protein